MTNFSELKKQNPLSFRLFEQWVEQNYETTLNIWNGTIRNEDVVEFLDELDIYINQTTTHGATFMEIYQHSNGITTSFGFNIPFKTRREAIENAIKKAFELLETKLKQN